MDKNPNVEVVWEAIPGSSQELAVDTRCDHTLYHGTRGPGKTITQLMRFRRHVGVGYGSYWRGIIFDREFKNLSDLVAQSKRFFEDFDDGASFKSSASEYKWVWKTGEELLFRHVKKLSDYEDFHGHEYPFIGWNELTKHPTAELYDKMMSTNRSSFLPEKDTPLLLDAKGNAMTNDWGVKLYNTPDNMPLKNIPLEVFSTTNPSGPGHNWVKRRFINCASNGEVVRKEIKVFDPRAQKECIVSKSQVAIFGSYRENIYLDAKYIAELDMLTSSNKNLREAWLNGNWDVTAGGALDDMWKRAVHVVPRFKIPKQWYVDRSFDWGSSHPFSVRWWAEANGEDIEMPDGSTFCPARGSLIQFAEWYGTDEIGTNKGLKLSAYKVAEGIVEREKILMEGGWIAKKPTPGPADTKRGGNVDSTEEDINSKMATKKVKWTDPIKKAGSRIQGLQLFRDRLESSITGEGPGIYFMSHCTGSIETIPSLPRDDKELDDIDTTSEDHCYDMARYRILKGNNRLAKKITAKHAT